MGGRRLGWGGGGGGGAVSCENSKLVLQGGNNLFNCYYSTKAVGLCSAHQLWFYFLSKLGEILRNCVESLCLSLSVSGHYYAIYH